MRAILPEAVHGLMRDFEFVGASHEPEGQLSSHAFAGLGGRKAAERSCGRGNVDAEAA
jgi:hypothetical protein